MPDFKILPTVNGTAVSLTTHNHSGVYQPLDAELTALAGLSSAADRLPYFTGSGIASLATFTSFARTLIDDANAATARATLELVAGGTGDIWVEKAGDTMTGTLVMDGILNLSQGGQDYNLAGNSGDNSLVLESQSSNNDNVVRLHTKDANGTDSVWLELWGKGKITAATNRERILIGYDNSTISYLIRSDAAGTGTVRPIKIYTGTNTNQLILNTDGTISIDGKIGIGDPATSPNSLLTLQPLSGWSLGQAISNAANSSAAFLFTPFGTISGTNPNWFVGQKYNSNGPLSFWAFDGSSHLSSLMTLNANSTVTVNGRIYVDDITTGGYVGNSTFLHQVNGFFRVQQNNSTASIPTVELTQSDNSEEFIQFNGNVNTTSGAPILTAGLGTYYGKIRVSVNGTFKYIPLYNS